MPTITPITNRETFDAATSTATTSTPTHPTGQPTVILISHSPSPPTKKFLPLYEELTKEERWKHVSFCRMEESAETAPLIKFGVQARPVVLFVSVLCLGVLGWCAALCCYGTYRWVCCYVWLACT